MISELAIPIWLPKANGYHSKPPSASLSPLCTNEGRGAYMVEVLEETIIASGVKELDVLEVGIGIDNKPFLCTYEPYFMAVALDKSGVKYRAVLLDKDSDTLNSVAERQEIYCTRSRYDNISQVKDVIDWYLRHTGVVSEEVFSLGGSTRSIKYNPRHEEQAIREARSGLMVMGIPPSFHRKLLTGQVRLVCGDIETTDLTKYPGFDFIACNNVLFYLSETGQQLAMFNMARALRVGGFLMMNDATGFDNSPVLKQIGGWLDNRKLEDLGLAIDRYWHDELSIDCDGEESRFLTLRKVK